MVAKGFLNLPNLHMQIKQESITSRNVALRTFVGKLIIVLNNGKSAILALYNDPDVLSSAFNKAKLFTKNFPDYSNLDDSGISLPVFPSRTNLKLHNIFVTPRMVKKVITNLDLLKAFGPDCIPVVVLKNCESDLSS